jgi:hypothetical protein
MLGSVLTGGGTDGKRPSLLECHFIADDIRGLPRDEKVTTRIRERSRNMAYPQNEVEKGTQKRTLGKTDSKEDFATSEEVV